MTPSLKLIQKAVSIHFYIPMDDIFRKSRQREYVVPRQWFHYLARKLTKNSFNQIGRFEGHNYNHATIIHSFSTVSNLIDIYPSDSFIAKELIERITKPLKVHSKSLTGYCASYPIKIVRPIAL